MKRGNIIRYLNYGIFKEDSSKYRQNEMSNVN